MKEKESSVTSLVAAFGRAYHSRYDHPVIFNDSLAGQLITEQEFAEISGHMIQGKDFFSRGAEEPVGEKPEDILRWITQVQLSPTPLARAAFCEAVLQSEVRLGAEQYVILGAGLDSFALRHPELAARLHVVEVDHPATQDFKRKRLEEAGLYVPDHLRFVPMDFADGADEGKWAAAGIGRGKTFFSLLGVSYYISEEDLAALLRTLFALVPKGSSIVLDYADEHLFEAQGRANRVQNMLAMAAAGGEPMKACYSQAALTRLLEQAGLLVYEHLTPEAIQERFFRDREDYLSAFETIHYIHAVKI
ncbi:class I SAM-dependent methyltransferase [Paenibacillus sp. NFR01]|uniref:class I SAM-dependent methyltransferase n=1 Tax=Paenibacillus sp. NFR01 TaxID=1566279 RepID=UPI0008D63FA8|nr:class I SAM-dependent methyltransferase [Paenibacillus sp. NFR01]SET86837.1 methyltransferase, TIGR00027 family [Paenibacillus sp. NFR01]